MNLQNGYKVIYEKAANGKRTFYATKNVVCDPTVDDKIIEATIGEYKLIYEKAGQFYGSTTGIPAEGDHCFTEFDKVFKAASEEDKGNLKNDAVETPDASIEIPEGEPTIEQPAVEEDGEF
jgi:hypothetical protein